MYIKKHGYSEYFIVDDAVLERLVVRGFTSWRLSLTNRQQKGDVLADFNDFEIATRVGLMLAKAIDDHDTFDLDAAIRAATKRSPMH